ncbi:MULTISPECIES: hypothetical protein [unclassified Pseudomonas]|uniref:hypothetical protein n=1 Tax=unclassified Pseudomonas TaxID=196821 RepID=UPI002A371E1F|nr:MULTISPECIES: hypothetical protein [unclassified Pseudomonas]MDX9670866.1 hypothetical protein [Pseudomonas sp. P8_250]WPN35142.1 hypothetical protein QMK53_23530 [Pseudomonas sp. P8_139]WPN43058.1 hypothetical protein QMK55_07845 [Pseudomonas sp. P8_229]
MHRLSLVGKLDERPGLEDKDFLVTHEPTQEYMFYTSKPRQLIKIDRGMDAIPADEVTAELIDTWVCSKAFDFLKAVPSRISFVLELSVHKEAFWKRLVALAPRRYWINSQQAGVLVFDANQDCGCLRTYRLTTGETHDELAFTNKPWIKLQSEEELYKLLDTPTGKHVFEAWQDHTRKILSMPIQFVEGRLANTSVEKTFVFAKGNGCVVCGKNAECYAATTIGSPTAAVMIQMSVCSEHLASAKEHPSTFSFLASLFSLSWDLPALNKLDSIPDDLIPTIHTLAAKELGGTVGSAQKRKRGWHLRLSLPSGWHWLLRVNSMTDFAYMLYEPGIPTERYRADSARDHRDVPFFPIHQHSNPDEDDDEVTPSFLYGHPLFDIKGLLSAGKRYGAY